MNEPTDVEARFSAEGAITLLSFTWQGHRLRVTSMGRQWASGETTHYLVMAAGDRIFELTHQRDQGRWQVASVNDVRPTA